MATKRWDELDPRLRKAIVLAATFEGGLKVAALIDLAVRPSKDIRGSKAVWGTAIALVNSAGVLPIVYLLRGRRL